MVKLEAGKGLRYCVIEIDVSFSISQNVERSFALLLHRFPRLKLLTQRTLRKKIQVVLAACVLHNLCILEGDDIDGYLTLNAVVSYSLHVITDVNVCLTVIYCMNCVF